MIWPDARCNASIRARVLVLTLVPLIALSLTLGPYCVFSRIKDLDIALKDRGDAALQYLVMESAAPLAAQDRGHLAVLAAAVAAEDDIQQVTILAPNREVLAHAGVKFAAADDDKVMTLAVPVTRAANWRDANVGPSPAESGDVTLGWIELQMSRESTISRRHSMIVNIALLTGGAVTLSLLIALWMGRGIVVPIIRLRDAVEGIRKGRLETRVRSTAGSELGALEQGFNDMAEVMERSQTRLQREVGTATRRLCHTIEALEDQNRELELARQKALGASEEKANFLANMSHEIRTPLNAILGYTTLLGRSGLTSEQHEHARTISCASRQLLRIIDDILSFSKLESGTVELDFTDFDLRDVFEDVLAMMAPEARDKHLELVLIIDSDVPGKVRGDPVRIGQVLINLLGNAIKFTERGGVVVQVQLAGVSSGRAEMEVRVTDTGIGIETEAIARIFDSFQQADASISRQYGGAGLGLAIVSRLVKLWGGEVGVSSEPGKGSTFWFRFSGEVAEPSRERAGDPLLAGRQVLLYDDNPAAMRAVRNLLLGWRVETFIARRREAIETMLDAARSAGRPYEVVILGIDLAHDIREHDSHRLMDLIRQGFEVPVMLMVNCKETSLLGRSLSDERIKIVIKPIRRDIVHRNLCSLLGLNDAQDSPEAAASACGSGEFKGLRILLAEDNEFNRSLVTHLLEAAGVVVAATASGDEALEVARGQDFDLVIMDLHLPGLDGAETARRLRELRPSLQNIVIVALTADVFFDAPDKLRSACMDACLLKPLDEEKLWNTLRRLRPRHGFNIKPPPSALPSSVEIRRLLEPQLISAIQRYRGQISKAITQLDYLALSGLVHELKGVVGYFGFADLTRAVIELETAIGQNSEPAEISGLFARLDGLIELTVKGALSTQEQTAEADGVI